MFRITPAASRVTQTMQVIISSRKTVGHAWGLLMCSASPYRKIQNHKINGPRSDFLEHFIASKKVSLQTSKGFHTIHRPSITSFSPKVIPLMQGFQTSAPKQAFHGPSTVDSLIFPSPQTNPSLTATVRVPLLPDNYSPDRSPNSVNENYIFDVIFPIPEISIIASHPKDVLPITISEVVGSESLEMHLTHLTRPFSDSLI